MLQTLPPFVFLFLSVIFHCIAFIAPHPPSPPPMNTVAVVIIIVREFVYSYSRTCACAMPWFAKKKRIIAAQRGDVQRRTSSVLPSPLPSAIAKNEAQIIFCKYILVEKIYFFFKSVTTNNNTFTVTMPCATTVD